MPLSGTVVQATPSEGGGRCRAQWCETRQATPSEGSGRSRAQGGHWRHFSLDHEEIVKTFQLGPRGRGGRHAGGARAKQGKWAVVEAHHVLLEEPRIGSRCGARGKTGSRCGARGQLLRFGAQAAQAAPEREDDTWQCSCRYPPSGRIKRRRVGSAQISAGGWTGSGIVSRCFLALARHCRE